METMNLIKEINDLTDLINAYKKEEEHLLKMHASASIKRDKLLTELAKARENVPV